MFRCRLRRALVYLLAALWSAAAAADKPIVYYFQGRVVVVVDLRNQQERPQGATITAVVTRPGDKEALCRAETELPVEGRMTEILVDARTLRSGPYAVRV